MSSIEAGLLSSASSWSTTPLRLSAILTLLDRVAGSVGMCVSAKSAKRDSSTDFLSAAESPPASSAPPAAAVARNWRRDGRSEMGMAILAAKGASVKEREQAGKLHPNKARVLWQVAARRYIGCMRIVIC